MKKTLFFLLLSMMLSAFTSCDLSGEKYYQITNNSQYVLSGMVCEYDTYDNCINTMSFHLDVGESTPSILAAEQCNKVKIFLSDYNKWVADVYYPNSVFAINILLDSSTELIDREP